MKRQEREGRRGTIFQAFPAFRALVSYVRTKDIAAKLTTLSSSMFHCS